MSERAAPRSAPSQGAEIQLSSRGLLRLLQITSPSFPIGAFAYSQGLEQAAERGFVRDGTTLTDWLAGVLSHSLAATDLPLVAHACEAFSNNDMGEIERLTALALALRETHELRAEERRLGAALARVLDGLGVTSASSYVGSKNASYAVLFALAATAFDVPKVAALHGYAFAWLENQVVGATRVISLGQTDAQRALLGVAESIPAAVDTALGIASDSIGRSAVGVCMSSAWHEQQYSRLFRS